LLLVDGLSPCNGLLHLADAVELFAHISDALVSDPTLPSIDSEAPPVFGGGRGRVGLCGYGRGRARERERERGREAAVEREKEKVISSQIIPTVPKMMAYQVLCGYGRGRATERERGERERCSGGWRSSVAEDCEKNKNQLLLFSFYFIVLS
jgi:hypothetical protein